MPDSRRTCAAKWHAAARQAGTAASRKQQRRAACAARRTSPEETGFAVTSETSTTSATASRATNAVPPAKNTRLHTAPQHGRAHQSCREHGKALPLASAGCFRPPPQSTRHAGSHICPSLLHCLSLLSLPPPPHPRILTVGATCSVALGEIQHYAKNTKKFCRFFEFLKRGTMSEFLYRWSRAFAIRHEFGRALHWRHTGTRTECA